MTNLSPKNKVSSELLDSGGLFVKVDFEPVAVVRNSTEQVLNT